MTHSAIDFRMQWEAAGDTLVRFTEAHLAGIPLSTVNRAFLLQAGLPDGAAPFLSFEVPTTGALRTVADLWHLGSDFPVAHVIGSNGNGDPIGIANDGHVYAFNHDNHFVPVFIASSIAQLASLLLAYREVVVYSQSVNGPDALLDNNIPPDIQTWFRDQVQQIDPTALTSHSLWQSELTSWQVDSTA